MQIIISSVGLVGAGPGVQEVRAVCLSRLSVINALSVVLKPNSVHIFIVGGETVDRDVLAEWKM